MSAKILHYGLWRKPSSGICTIYTYQSAKSVGRQPIPQLLSAVEKEVLQSPVFNPESGHNRVPSAPRGSWTVILSFCPGNRSPYAILSKFKIPMDRPPNSHHYPPQARNDHAVKDVEQEMQMEMHEEKSKEIDNGVWI